GAEGDELVEGMTGEAGGTARLGIENRPLGVGRGRRREDQPADHEDERRQPKRDPRDEPERVVDRGADVAVGSRKQGRRAEHPLQPLLTTPSRHGRMLCRETAERAADVPRPEPGLDPAGRQVPPATRRQEEGGSRGNMVSPVLTRHGRTLLSGTASYPAGLILFQ